MAHNHNNEEAKAGQSQALCQPKSCNIPVSALLQSSVIKCHKMGLFLVSLPPPPHLFQIILPPFIYPDDVH